MTLAGFAARVLWFDAQVTRALDSGVTQVAGIGAGYDSRAWRFRRDGVRFFELDREATQQDKVRRAPGPDPTYVAADLATQNAGEALLARGLDGSRAALFVVEGLTMYLDGQVVRRLLRELAMATAGGSRLAVEFHPPSDTGTSRNRRQRLLQRLARTGSGETLHCLVDRPGAVDLVQASGWDVTEAISARDAAHAFVLPASGLPIDAINEHGALLAASHT